MIEISGNPFFITLNFFFKFLVISLTYCLLCNGLRAFMSKKNLFILTISVILLIITLCLSFDQNIDSYINVFLRILCACLIASCFSVEEYACKFVNIIFFLSIISLLCWSLQILRPSTINDIYSFFNMSITTTFAETGRYVALPLLFTFNSQYGLGTKEIWGFSRNNGIFWEPGAHQFFIVLALILLVEYRRKEENYPFKLLVLLVTLCSTGSSTGILSLIVFAIVYHREAFQGIYVYINRHKLQTITFISLLIVIAAQYGVYLFSGFGKLSGELLNLNLIAERTSISGLDALLSGNFLTGLGITTVNELGISAYNTLIYFLASFGILGFAFIVGLYCYSYRNLFHHYFGALILLMIGFSTEVWIIYPICYIFWFLDRDNYLMNCEE